MAEAPTLFHVTTYNSVSGRSLLSPWTTGEDYKKPNTFGEKA